MQATRPRKKKKWGTKIRTTIPKYEMETVRLIARKGEENAKNAKLFVMTNTTRRPDALLTYLNLFIREQDKAVDKLLSGSSRRVLTASQKQLEDR